MNKNKVICGITMPIDGFVAGPNMSEEKPFGDLPEGDEPPNWFKLKDGFDRLIEYFEIHKNILPVDQFARFKLNRDHLIQSINRTE